MSAAVIGGALGAGASLMATGENNQAIEDQAQAQEYQASETLLAGRSQASQIRSQADSITGGIKSSAAGSGVQVNTGSVLDVIEESAYNVELDALTTESNAKRSYSNQVATADSTRSAKKTGVSALLSAFGGGASGAASGSQLGSLF